MCLGLGPKIIWANNLCDLIISEDGTAATGIRARGWLRANFVMKQWHSSGMMPAMKGREQRQIIPSRLYLGGELWDAFEFSPLQNESKYLLYISLRYFPVKANVFHQN
jgi:hypothetical protein